MRIVYDHQIFSWQKYGGISRYFFELCTRMAAFRECDVSVLAPLYVNAYFKYNNSNMVIGRYIPRIPRTAGLMTWLNSTVVRVLLKRDPPDIVHETYYTAKKLSHRNTKTVVTVYDMVHERLPHYLRPGDNTSWKKAQAVKRADHVICISENTRKDLLQIFDTDTSKVSAIYLGHWNIPIIAASSTRLVSEPYILYVGMRNRHKNFDRFLGAYAASDRLRRDFKLVCLGGGRFSEREVKRVLRLGLDLGNILQIDGADDVSVNLYSHASVFVYPSLYEGFGLPVLEAMSSCCPVACSATSSLPEVAGDAAEYFAPDDGDSIVSAIEAVVYSNERTHNLISAGLERVAHFSWEKCVDQTKKVYSSLL
jgi:glycosyltransferase involved in cell wall biosynthesis